MRQRKVLNNGSIKIINITESGNITFRVRCPVFVLLQWISYGGTFSLIPTPNSTDFYTPSFFRDKDSKNFLDTVCNELTTKFQNFHIWLYNFYRKLIDLGVHREQASMVLPQSTFVEFYWVVNTVSLPQTSNNQELSEYFSAIKTLLP